MESITYLLRLGKNYNDRQLKNAENWKKESSSGRSTPTDVPTPNGRPWKYIHTRGIIQTEQAVVKDIFVYTYTHITAMNEKR